MAKSHLLSFLTSTYRLVAWSSGNALSRIDEVTTAGPVSTWMGDCLRAGKPSGFEASQPARSTQPSTLRGMVN